MLTWEGCGVRWGICGPRAGGNLPSNTLDHQHCVKSGQRGSFKQVATYTTQWVLTALGFAHLVARSFQNVWFSLHLTPLERGTHSSVLLRKQAAAACATEGVLSRHPAAALTAQPREAPQADAGWAVAPGTSTRLVSFQRGQRVLENKAEVCSTNHKLKNKGKHISFPHQGGRR